MNAKLLPIRLITATTPGLEPIPDDCTGLTLVLDPSRLKERCRFARNQIVQRAGGFGCKAHARGTKIFGEHLDGEHAQWRSGDFIGVASAELIERAKLDDSQEKPVDLSDRCFMAVGPGYFGKGDTIEEALKQLGKAMYKKRAPKLGQKGVSVYKVHREAYINDFCQLVSQGGIVEVK